ncbi:hypothetical protein LQG66_03935 [Bradyrhizobium ontarionense]|uniref:MarR family transcriptional regulator n=1 Tax=Bradyrhizobium ontarionense TaxID=2898149 RepID=A0ABY3REE6_9BRAD|nr:hypothetical protein [Bradyrhizobium sp. A19]UFZ05477.1 hypothetical protein LQG66_03935 [Bradyrhizobium sp. A19]
MAMFHQQAKLDVRVPKGNEGFWLIMNHLQILNGEFTVGDIDELTCSCVQNVSKYLTGLLNAGIAEQVGERPPKAKGQFASPLYRLVKTPVLAPRVRDDGSLIPATAQECVWNAMRTLKQFNVPELIFAATTDQVKPKEPATRRYVMLIERAGYLVRVGKCQPIRYRLKPDMNTGPQPPSCKLFDVRVVWDPNLKRFFGDAPEAREVAP